MLPSALQRPELEFGEAVTRLKFKCIETEMVSLWVTFKEK